MNTHDDQKPKLSPHSPRLDFIKGLLSKFHFESVFGENAKAASEDNTHYRYDQIRYYFAPKWL